MRLQVLRAALAVVTCAGLVAVGEAPAAAAAPSVTLSALSGVPTGTVTVSGAGFGAHETVDIYFDTTDEALASTNGSGAFSGITIGIPAPATPGIHYITADGRHSGLSAQAQFVVSTNWAQYRYSVLHKGYNPYENVLSASDVSGIDLDWSYSTGKSIQSSPAVTTTVTRNASGAVASETVYIGSNSGSVYALNAATGTQKWTFSTGGVVASSPAVVGGVVYVGSDSGNMYALNASTGAELWSFATGSEVVSSPAVVNGVVYVGGGNDNLYALNATTGEEKWSFTAASYVASSPAVANGRVYIGAGDNEYALNAATGAQVWSFTASNVVFSSPAVANGVVYVGAEDDNVYALNAATGAQLWSFNTGGLVASSPAVANGVVYIGSYSGDVYALNASTGAELWSFATGGDVLSSPAVANGTVYVGSFDGDVYSFDLAGGDATVNRPAPGGLHPNYALRPQNGKGS